MAYLGIELQELFKIKKKEACQSGRRFLRDA